jgi:hypothetical protein
MSTQTDVAQRRRREAVSAAIAHVCPDLVVRHGPFAGMRYPEVRSIGGPLFPRLLGSYERELTTLVEAACRAGYTDVVNIGCGEGYYAIGFALRIPGATVYAYDTDAEALMLCRRMARLNGVADRIVTGPFCDARRLMSLRFRERALVVSDCEGYERTLFSEAVAHFLAMHDALIEVHDFVDPSISMVLRTAFMATHALTPVRSLPDDAKPLTYDYPELVGYDIVARQLLLAEMRPASMEWFMCRARVESHGT